MDRRSSNPAALLEIWDGLDAGQQAFLRDLAAHPGVQRDGATIQAALGFARHRDVALAAYAIGEALRERGVSRPWAEGQRGYTMPADVAEVVNRAAAR